MNASLRVRHQARMRAAIETLAATSTRDGAHALEPVVEAPRADAAPAALTSHAPPRRVPLVYLRAPKAEMEARVDVLVREALAAALARDGSDLLDRDRIGDGALRTPASGADVPEGCAPLVSRSAAPTQRRAQIDVLDRKALSSSLARDRADFLERVLLLARASTTPCAVVDDPAGLRVPFVAVRTPPPQPLGEVPVLGREALATALARDRLHEPDGPSPPAPARLALGTPRAADHDRRQCLPHVALGAAPANGSRGRQAPVGEAGTSAPLRDLS